MAYNTAFQRACFFEPLQEHSIRNYRFRRMLGKSGRISASVDSFKKKYKHTESTELVAELLPTMRTSEKFKTLPE
ncbi:MAG: hypothetical protein GY697_27855 [Desulfobacterales bacterium]|nr:hypothetical protein [Desulfobacterales bacterium]